MTLYVEWKYSSIVKVSTHISVRVVTPWILLLDIGIFISDPGVLNYFPKIQPASMFFINWLRYIKENTVKGERTLTVYKGHNSYFHISSWKSLCMYSPSFPIKCSCKFYHFYQSMFWAQRTLTMGYKRVLGFRDGNHTSTEHARLVLTVLPHVRWPGWGTYRAARHCRQDQAAAATASDRNISILDRTSVTRATDECGYIRRFLVFLGIGRVWTPTLFSVSLSVYPI